MKQLKLLIAILLAGISAEAQKDSVKWVQIRKISNNHAVDEWVRQGDTLPISKDTIRVHDTVTVFKCPPAAPDPPGIIFTSSGMFFTSSVISRKPRPKKKPKQKYYLAVGSNVPCEPDTIRGIILYNNGKLRDRGNVTDSGYWVGCFAAEKFINVNNSIIIPGKFQEVQIQLINNQFVERIKSSHEGNFYTKDGDPILSQNVYFLYINLRQ